MDLNHQFRGLWLVDDPQILVTVAGTVPHPGGETGTSIPLLAASGEQQKCVFFSLRPDFTVVLWCFGVFLHTVVTVMCSFCLSLLPSAHQLCSRPFIPLLPPVLVNSLRLTNRLAFLRRDMLSQKWCALTMCLVMQGDEAIIVQVHGKRCFNKKLTASKTTDSDKQLCGLSLSVCGVFDLSVPQIITLLFVQKYKTSTMFVWHVIHNVIALSTSGGGIPATSTSRPINAWIWEAQTVTTYNR